MKSPSTSAYDILENNDVNISVKKIDLINKDSNINTNNIKNNYKSNNNANNNNNDITNTLDNKFKNTIKLNFYKPVKVVKDKTHNTVDIYCTEFKGKEVNNRNIILTKTYTNNNNNSINNNNNKNEEYKKYSSNNKSIHIEKTEPYEINTINYTENKLNQENDLTPLALINAINCQSNNNENNKLATLDLTDDNLKESSKNILNNTANNNILSKDVFSYPDFRSTLEKCGAYTNSNYKNNGNLNDKTNCINSNYNNFPSTKSHFKSFSLDYNDWNAFIDFSSSNRNNKKKRLSNNDYSNNNYRADIIFKDHRNKSSSKDNYNLSIKNNRNHSNWVYNHNYLNYNNKSSVNKKVKRNSSAVTTNKLKIIKNCLVNNKNSKDSNYEELITNIHKINSHTRKQNLTQNIKLNRLLYKYEEKSNENLIGKVNNNNNDSNTPIIATKNNEDSNHSNLLLNEINSYYKQKKQEEEREDKDNQSMIEIKKQLNNFYTNNNYKINDKNKNNNLNHNEETSISPLCLFCNDLYNNPYSCYKCNTILCLDCFKETISKYNKCYICFNNISLDLLKQSKIDINFLYKNFYLNCPFTCCNKKINIKDFKEHFSSCDFKKPRRYYNELIADKDYISEYSYNPIEFYNKNTDWVGLFGEIKDNKNNRDKKENKDNSNSSSLYKKINFINNINSMNNEDSNKDSNSNTEYFRLDENNKVFSFNNLIDLETNRTNVMSFKNKTDSKLYDSTNRSSDVGLCKNIHKLFSDSLFEFNMISFTNEENKEFEDAENMDNNNSGNKEKISNKAYLDFRDNNNNISCNNNNNNEIYTIIKNKRLQQNSKIKSFSSSLKLQNNNDSNKNNINGNIIHDSHTNKTSKLLYPEIYSYLAKFDSYEDNDLKEKDGLYENKNLIKSVKSYSQYINNTNDIEYDCFIKKTKTKKNEENKHNEDNNNINKIIDKKNKTIHYNSELIVELENIRNINEGILINSIERMKNYSMETNKKLYEILYNLKKEDK